MLLMFRVGNRIRTCDTAFAELGLNQLGDTYITTCGTSQINILIFKIFIIRFKMYISMTISTDNNTFVNFIFKRL